MNKTHLASLLIAATLIGCREQEDVAIISVGVFEALDRTKEPSLADLVSMKAFTDSFYNPDQSPVLVDDSEIEKIGYHYWMSANSELPKEQRELFHQGIARGKPFQTAVTAMITPVAGNGYELSVNFLEGANELQESNKETAFIGVAGAGSLKLNNGLIITWVTKPKK